MIFFSVYEVWSGSIVTSVGNYIEYIKSRMCGKGVIFSPQKKYFRATFNQLQEFLSKYYLTHSEYLDNYTTRTEGPKLANQLTTWLNSML